jgi:hypothetical protein
MRRSIGIIASRCIGARCIGRSIRNRSIGLSRCITMSRTKKRGDLWVRLIIRKLGKIWKILARWNRSIRNLYKIIKKKH